MATAARASSRAAGIAAEVSGRPKHIYSIWSKMQRKQAEHRRALRHPRGARPRRRREGLLRRARPRAPPVDADAERVRRLHREAEGEQLPLAAHRGDRARKASRSRCRSARARCTSTPSSASPRTGATRKAAARARAAIRLRREDRVAAPGARLEGRGRRRERVAGRRSRSSLFTDTIYVLTPQGKVIDLPRGATPVDFAYAVHTELGHRCRGAKVDGADGAAQHAARERPAGRDPHGEAGRAVARLAQSRARLRARATARAPRCGSGSRRSSTRRRSRRAARWSSASSRALGATALKLDARRGQGGLREDSTISSRRSRATRSTASRCRPRSRRVAQPAHAAPTPGRDAEVVTRKSRAAGSGGGILVVGVDRLLTGLARCCKPAPPDPIVGFVTRGKGVTIHRAICANVARMRAREPERLIDAELGRAARRSVSRSTSSSRRCDRRGCCATSPRCSRARRSTSPRRTR